MRSIFSSPKSNLLIWSSNQSSVTLALLWEKLSKLQLYKDRTIKTTLFGGWSWFKFNKLEKYINWVCWNIFFPGALTIDMKKLDKKNCQNLKRYQVSLCIIFVGNCSNIIYLYIYLYNSIIYIYIYIYICNILLIIYI